MSTVGAVANINPLFSIFEVYATVAICGIWDHTMGIQAARLGGVAHIDPNRPSVLWGSRALGSPSALGLWGIGQSPSLVNIALRYRLSYLWGIPGPPAH